MKAMRFDSRGVVKSVRKEGVTVSFFAENMERVN
jgi:hypothetical protein